MAFARQRLVGRVLRLSDLHPGDEFRRIDWNAYARLERLFVRLYRAEEDLSLAVVLDASASMAWGKPTKGRLAAQLAGALAFIALQSGDRVEIAACREAGRRRSGCATCAARPPPGPPGALLERLEFSGATDLNAALAASARHLRGAGLTVVVSDLFSPTATSKASTRCSADARTCCSCTCCRPDELQPPADLLGEWRLLDSEPTAPLEATITPGVLRAYRRLLDGFRRRSRRLLPPPRADLSPAAQRRRPARRPAAHVPHGRHPGVAGGRRGLSRPSRLPRWAPRCWLAILATLPAAAAAADAPHLEHVPVARRAARRSQAQQALAAGAAELAAAAADRAPCSPWSPPLARPFMLSADSSGPFSRRPARCLRVDAGHRRRRRRASKPREPRRADDRCAGAGPAAGAGQPGRPAAASSPAERATAASCSARSNSVAADHPVSQPARRAVASPAPSPRATPTHRSTIVGDGSLDRSQVAANFPLPVRYLGVGSSRRRQPRRRRARHARRPMGSLSALARVVELRLASRRPPR